MFRKGFFILIFVSMMLKTVECSQKAEEFNSCNNVYDTPKKFKKSLFEKYILEKDDKFDSITLSSNPDQTYNVTNGPSSVEEYSMPSSFDLFKIPSTSSSFSKTFTTFTNNQIQNVHDLVNNEDMNKQLINHKRRGDNAMHSSGKQKYSGCVLELSYCEQIQKHVEKSIPENLKSQYSDYLNFTHTDFILIRIKTLIKDSFSCCNWLNIDDFIPFIVDIFIYSKFKEINTALIGEKRVQKFTLEMKELVGTFEISSTPSKYIFITDKKIKEYSKSYLAKYPNFSHRVNCPKDKDSEDNSNVLITQIMEYLPRYRNNIISDLSNLIIKYLNHSCSKLDKKDREVIGSLIYKPIYFWPFESIIDCDIRGISLEQDDSFEKIY